MNHEIYMQRCLELAALGRGKTSPNPMVGSVIVENGEIIGEGWHHRAGEPHAEVNAINSVKDRTRLTTATLYVNLEPCAHYGKTPPCALRIIEEKIPQVVIGTRDPHSAVAGKGIEMMRAKGIHVEEGILTDACSELNKAFFTFHKHKRPFITLKFAKTNDGFLAPENENREAGEPAWITGEESKQRVHKLRAEVDAILVGGRTVAMDNPSLTTRLWPGKNPQRIIWTNRPIDAKSIVMSDGNPTWVIGLNAAQHGYSHPVEAWNASSIIELVHSLFKRNITHLLVEGGKQTLNQFISEDLWDEAFVLTGQAEFKSGLKAPEINNAKLDSREMVGGDTWQRFIRL
ncbi:MAG: bifunctional diaminohydroxyphosphoribosylaminopyrimidine deaminase/5-amino-6-(5-phosphoribosylamino)uracil reductase RibD [Flavobacteriia bacterium]|nr:bifunctional diaminohydroxyphosphoribosylaminopyrimidine deaminase/5-amino-6-(5-phosphoribosylamino)uracil reductase RibD [Flavobacteriia bacterium]